MGHMSGRPCLLLALCFVFAPNAFGQDEQRLRYRSAQTPEKYGVDADDVTLELTPRKPKGVKLPALAGTDPLFAKWATPMVRAGHLWIALDRSKPGGPYNRLFIDSDADGSLADEQPVEAHFVRDSRGTDTRPNFSPVKVVLAGEDGPVTYHLNLKCSISLTLGKGRVRASAAGWYEGAVSAGGRKYRFRLIDNNANGTFNDASVDPRRTDRIVLVTDWQEIPNSAGRYVHLDGALHHLEIARDGAYVKLRRAKNVPMGTLRVAERTRQLIVGGRNGLFRLQPTAGRAQLPVGKYRLQEWRMRRRDEYGAIWEATGSPLAVEISFEVVKDRETQLAVGEPFRAVAIVRRNGKDYSFGHPLVGRLGEQISLTYNGVGGRPSAPILRIRNADGSYDRSFAFEYG